MNIYHILAPVNMTIDLSPLALSPPSFHTCSSIEFQHDRLLAYHELPSTDNDAPVCLMT
jgi:hypothetical protein